MRIRIRSVTLMWIRIKVMWICDRWSTIPNLRGSISNDPAFHLNADPDPIRQIRIRNLLLIKVIWICDHWSTKPSRLYF